MVRLLQEFKPPTVPVLTNCFNPTMVRLLLVPPIDSDLARDCFNPTMVRLLRMLKRSLVCKAKMFQSHNGAIAARIVNEVLMLSVPGFNPTMVRLLLGYRSLRYNEEGESFNPTMVRLLRAAALQSILKTQFQSHNGAIAAANEQVALEVAKRFNPTMVRLLRGGDGNEM
mgnify:CR=1 FL=1